MMKAEAAVSEPRFGPLAHAWGSLEAFGPYGISVTRQEGVFWHHALSEIMEDLIADGNEFIFTTDYDTMFSKDQVGALLKIMEARQDVDALCAMQCHRQKFAVMGSPIEKTTDGLMRMSEAHFGLTVLRARSLHELPRPWFTETPNEHGRWGKGSVHADIGFWKNWKEAGKTLFQASHVVVGHMGEFIMWPAKGGGVVYQPLSDWLCTKHPPEGAIGT